MDVKNMGRMTKSPSLMLREQFIKNNKMKFDLLVQVDTLAKFMKKANPELREGQCLMNALFEVNRILYIQITGTEADCFYDDKKIPDFWNKLSEH